MQAPSQFPLSATNDDALDDLVNSGTGRNTPSLSNPLSSLFPPVSSSAQYLDPFQSTAGIHHQIPADLAAAFPDFDSATNTNNTSNHNTNAFHSNSASLAGNDLNWLLPSANESIAPAASLPAPDQFDEDLERALADLGPAQLSWLNTLDTVDFTQHQFSYHRGGTLSHPGGPLSAITASSESAYNGIGDDGRSESYYNPYSPQGSLVNAANPSQLNPTLSQALENFSADLAAFGISDNGQNPLLNGDTSIQPAQTTSSSTSANLHSVSPNPIQPPTVNLDLLMPSSTASYSSFDDSGNSARDTSPNDHLLHLGRLSNDDGAAAEMEREFGTSTNLLSAAANFAQVPPQSAIDPRKKYQCPNCPRGEHPFPPAPFLPFSLPLSISITFFNIAVDDRITDDRLMLVGYSLCTRVQPQDAHGHARPQPTQATHMPPPQLWSILFA
jgi:hypothetical protein